MCVYITPVETTRFYAILCVHNRPPEGGDPHDRRTEAVPRRLPQIQTTPHPPGRSPRNVLLHQTGCRPETDARQYLYQVAALQVHRLQSPSVNRI